MAKKVRTITQKLNDIAEAGWEAGDLHADGDDYGQIGDKAEARIQRLAKQVKALALVAIQEKLGLDASTVADIVTAPEIDEIVAEAVVGAWDKVETLVYDAKFKAAQARTRASVNALADPLTGAVIVLEPRKQQCCSYYSARYGCPVHGQNLRPAVNPARTIHRGTFRETCAEHGCPGCK